MYVNHAQYDKEYNNCLDRDALGPLVSVQEH